MQVNWFKTVDFGLIVKFWVLFVHHFPKFLVAQLSISIRIKFCKCLHIVTLTNKRVWMGDAAKMHLGRLCFQTENWYTTDYGGQHKIQYIQTRWDVREFGNKIFLNAFLLGNPIITTFSTCSLVRFLESLTISVLVM